MTLQRQTVFPNLAPKTNNFSQDFVKIGIKQAIPSLFLKPNSAKLVNFTFYLRYFDCLEASTSELHVRGNSAASSKCAGWVHLTPYLALKNHVRNIIIFVTCIL